VLAVPGVTTDKNILATVAEATVTQGITVTVVQSREACQGGCSPGGLQRLVQLAEPVGKPQILGVVDRAADQRHAVVVECGLQRR